MRIRTCKMNHFNKLCLILALSVQLGDVFAQVAVVVGAKSDIAALTVDQVTSIYLGKTDKLPNGNTALPLDQVSGSAVRSNFYEKVTGKSEAQVKAAWSRLVFSGKGTPPKEIGSSAEIKKLVATTPNMMGYIEKSAVDSSVKVILYHDY